MNPFELYIAYVAWEAGGKRRPVLIFSNTEDGVRAFGITSQYESKSAAIRAKYFKINDWQQAGLDKQSYVDTIRLIKLQQDVVDNATAIGQLTKADRKLLVEFLAN
ncbi:MazF family toxin-antitoxin system [Clostridia bacterium]|nr:MazF family toxin-antitoxin system [Clostridia bacterium]